MAVLTHINIFPIKSLDGIGRDCIDVLPSGALAGDRRFAMFDAQGCFVNGKRNARVHLLAAEFAADLSTVRLTPRPSAESDLRAEGFALAAGNDELNNWLSEFFGEAVEIREDRNHGFPDDLDAPGPTVISSQTLQAVAEWYDGLEVGEARRRFRTNLEISAESAFWEDRLFGAAGETVRFLIGDVRWEGANPCQRCVVPTRHSTTGAPTAKFGPLFQQRREATLPEWAERNRFDHFYRLAVNTRLSAEQNDGVLTLNVGDNVSVECA